MWKLWWKWLELMAIACLWVSSGLQWPAYTLLGMRILKAQGGVGMGVPLFLPSF